MQAILKENCGVYGIHCLDAGQLVEVEPFIEEGGKLSEQYFVLKGGWLAGSVFDKKNLEFTSNG